MEKQKKVLSDKILNLEMLIKKQTSELIDIDLLKRVYRDFSEVFAGLSEKEKVKLIQMLIKEISVCENKVKITLYYLPEIALNIKEEMPGLYQPTIKLGC